MNYSTPSFPVLHHLLEFDQTQWCHPTISFSGAALSYCPQSFPASGSFPMSRLFTSGGQSTAASASVLPMNIQDWLPLGLTGWISLQSKGLSRVFSSTTLKSINSSALTSFMVQLSHPYMTTGKISFKYTELCWQIVSLLFNTLSRFRFVTAFKEQVSFNFMAAVTMCSALWAKENKIWHCFYFSSHLFPWSDGTGCHDLSFWKLSIKPAFLLSSFTLIKRLFSSS